jgi:predicted metal-dependent HD superfamily phosphohydrolase
MDDPIAADLPHGLSFDCPTSLIERLRVRYAEPHRRYHAWPHVLACLDARRRIARAAPPEVDLALLFHDAIYEPLAGDNEARSAALLVEEGRRAWIDDRVVRRAEGLVLATRHDHGDALDSEEACVVVDADLSILGAPRATFDRYEAEVRAEFAAIDDATFASGRTAVLRSLLARPSIFATHVGRRLWETAARRNLEASLAALATHVLPAAHGP